MPTNLADKQFWETEFYWADVALPCRPNPSIPHDRLVAETLAEQAPVTRGDTVIEIGCAPAKWLVFYAERFGARVSGVEYSAKGADLSRANLAASGVDGEIVTADFFAMEPTPHDLVLSLGFIEHFDDLRSTFARHVELVRPGGRLALGVPNFCGVNRALQRLAGPAFLARHNLAAMRPELFRSLAAEHGLELGYLDYFGGFDPALIAPDPGRSGVAATVAKACLYGGLAWRRLPISDRIDHGFFSVYLLGVFHRPA